MCLTDGEVQPAVGMRSFYIRSETVHSRKRLGEVEVGSGMVLAGQG